MPSETTLPSSPPRPPRQIHQPIHPSIRPHLDPEYIAFHEAHFQYAIPDDQKPWDGSARTTPAPWPPTASAQTKVGSIQDIQLDDFAVRIFTPSSSPTSENKNESASPGWPVLLWFHGGGWAIGGLNDGNDLCSLICATARCLVITVDYRLAPEYPYPTAINDAVTALKWVVSASGSETLGRIDNSRIAVGGTSAGGNIAAVLGMKASLLSPSVPICFQLLVVPVIDNTASVDGVWAENQHAPWLTPKRMEWYREMYLPDPAHRGKWDASPCFAPKELLAASPKTLVAVAEMDLLAPEARLFAGLLEGVGVGVEVVGYEGGTHSILSMSGVLSQGRRLLKDSAERVARAFWGDLESKQGW